MDNSIREKIKFDLLKINQVNLTENQYTKELSNLRQRYDIDNDDLHEIYWEILEEAKHEKTIQNEH